MKQRKTRTTCSMVLVGLGLALLGSTAWACTAFTSLTGPKAGVAQSQVTVEGESLIRERDADQEVELRWNASDGPLLAKVTTDNVGSLSATVTVPDVAPGIYFIMAIAGDAGVARMSFEVLPSAGGGVAGTGNRVPGFVDSEQVAQPVADTSSSVVPGVILLSVGLVLLTVGCGALVVQSRRRATPGSPSAPPDADLTP